MTDNSYKIGHLMSSSIIGFVAGCPIVDQEIPRFGEMVTAPLGKDRLYGIVYDITIEDDPIIAQIVNKSTPPDPTVVADNRVNRRVPMKISVLSIGYAQNNTIRHLLPPRVPLSLDTLNQCKTEDLVAFTNTGKFGYFRHILRNPDLPVAELLAAHVQAADAANTSAGNKDWGQKASQELITLLRDDYATLMNVLSALGDAIST